MMSREQSLGDLVLSLDSSELQEAEQVRAEISQQLSTDKGGSVLCSLVEYYLESWSSQVVLVLSSIRESHHKLLLEKLNESLNRPGTRTAGLTLLGHLIRKQPPWVHHISRSALLPSLLRCLKTDTDVVVLITGVLVLITLLPMIPQAGKQHIYDFFDVFGRLASWSYKNPNHVSEVHLVHLHAGVYSLFHRLYGMFPCSFISYLRLHYSMKENLDTFQEVIKPMLEHVKVHPELVTGTQDHELDPSRWRCYEVHDIMIECSRVCLDPLESSCEEDVYSSPKNTLPSLSFSLSSSKPPSASSVLPKLDLPSSPQPIGSSGSLTLPSQSGQAMLTQNSSCIQADGLMWSPSCQCGLSTPPPDSTHTLCRSSSISEKCPSAASIPDMPQTEDSPGADPPPDINNQVKLQPITVLMEESLKPITEKDERGQSNVITSSCEGITSNNSQQPHSTQSILLTSTPGRDDSSPSSSLPLPSSISLCFTPPPPSSSSSHRTADEYHTQPYESLFELALPQAATLFIRRKTQELMEKTGAECEEDRVEDLTSISPLEVLDRMIIHGHDAHEGQSRRYSAMKPVDLSHVGGKQPSMKNKGPTPADELQSLRSQLLLVHGQLQYERFKRQQHAIRNRRLLRRVINTTALEEQSVAMKAQLGVQEQEIRSLKLSLETEQGQYIKLQQDTDKHTKELQTYIQQLLLLLQDEQRRNQRLQGELQECQSGLRDLEAELQRANNQAYNAEHQLTQLSLKLCSSEQLQQHIFVLNQQLVLLRETNRALTEQLDGEDDHCTEASMLRCSVSKDYQRLKDSEVLHRQKLEAASHRITELENQLLKKDKLMLDQKKLLDDTKTQSRMELLACECRCLALRRITQTLQTEMLHLYSQVHLDTRGQSDVCTRSNGGSSVSPVSQGGREPHLQASSSASVINGDAEALSSSPLLFPSCSSSPIDSPLAIGSFLEQRSRQLFRTTIQNEEKREEEEEQDEAKPQSPSPSQEMEEAILDTDQDPEHPLPASEPLTNCAHLNLDVRQRRRELSIMDYDETLPGHWDDCRREDE